VREAYRNPADPWHRAAVAAYDTLAYFRFDHPARDNGRPMPLPGDLSPEFAARITGLSQQPLAVGDLLPEEAAAIAEHVETHRVWRNAGAEQRAEIEALHAHASIVREAASEAGADQAQQSTTPEAAMPQTTERIAELNRLLRDTRMSAPDRRVLVDELAQLLGEHPAGQAVPGAAAPPDLAATRSGAAAKEFTVTAPPGAGLTERSIALTDQLRGMKYHGSTERQAKLGELAEALIEAEPGPDVG
jgi:hypothetical protein